MRGIFGSAIVCSLALLLLPAAYVSARRTWADLLWHRARSSRMAQDACLLEPADPACWRGLARLTEQEGRDALAPWLRSLHLEPFDAESLIAAAASLELVGRNAEAERLLQRAERHNALWLPRWSLATFYLRQGRKEEFWRWARHAFELSYWDRGAMLGRCFDAGASARFLIDRVLPPRLDLRMDLLRFTIRRGAGPDLRDAAEAAAAAASPGDRNAAVPALLDAVETFARAGRPKQSFDIWNSMCSRGLLPYAPASLDKPLVNGELRAPFLERGFDWQTPQSTGVSSVALGEGRGARFTLTGQQDDESVLLFQWMYLAGGRQWDLRFEARTPGIDAAESGLRWRILDGVTGLPYEPDHEPFGGGEWTTATVRRIGPPAGRLIRLALVAGRRPGRIRMQGDVWIRRVAMEERP